ncbi:hypothetical protein LGH70_18685 [Hymenobacter sp. BT635]|uniref:PH domain-containing protein n=1 Tax=Hymenobacter nitidus TaxID=2880929 RepID=A0ABS8AGQ7_9BACT|nr:hypothetical protein [Hymenobacter nitidus]MCB2379630.1 hypothetical protein [Hymenobacter nitidus]
MDVIWGWQHVDFYPDERREQGPITEAAALVAYADFPWTEQLTQLTARYRAGLTSVRPGIWFRRGPETLTLTATDEWAVLAEYQVGKQAYFYQLSLSWWAHNLDPEDLIQMLFAGTLSQWPGWQHPDPYLDRATAAAPAPVRFASQSRPAWQWWWKPVGVEALLILGFLFTQLPWSALLLGGLLALVTVVPEAWLAWQYARVSRGQQVEIDPVRRWLRVQDQWGVLEFGREQVRECVVVQSVPGRFSRQQYSYVTFVLKNQQVCVIPRETGPPTEIAELLGVHYRLEKTGFASIGHRRLSARELTVAQRKHQQRIAEFRERFAAYSAAQLEEVVQNSQSYASHAVAAAEELLQSRTITNR